MDNHAFSFLPALVVVAWDFTPNGVDGEATLNQIQRLAAMDPAEGLDRYLTCVQQFGSKCVGTSEVSFL